jgi:hypothetical protein
VISSARTDSIGFRCRQPGLPKRNDTKGHSPLGRTDAGHPD